VIGGMAQANQSPPLAGVKVLDLTQFMSGPFATQILGDLGADVTKVEPPDGDLSRSLPPHFVGNDSAYFLSLNRNKKSVVLDLGVEDARGSLRHLASSADVIIENYRPGVAKRLGLDRAALQRERPSLIWCSISGFGQAGPYRDLPAYDIIIQAMSGGMSLTGERDGRPVRAGIPIADLAAGLYAVIGIAAALRRRELTGLGETIDISMLDCQVAMLTYQSAYVLAGGERPPPQGRGHESIPTYDSFTASDGVDVVIAANTDRMWRDLAAALGLDHLVSDPTLATVRDRNAARDRLRPLLEAAFGREPSAKWVERLRAVSVPVAAVTPVDQVLIDPQVIARGMIETFMAPTGEEVRLSGNPIRMAATRPTAHRYPPSLGADSAEVLGEKGP